MTEDELLELFRRALRTSLAVPLVAGMGACSSSAGTPDAAKVDTGVHGDSGRDRGAVDAGHDASVMPDSAELDAAKGEDAERRDARRPDAGDLCKVSLANRCPVIVPLFCFDGGISADAQLTPAQCNVDCPTGPGSSCSILPGFDGGGLSPSTPVSLECFFMCNGRAYAGMARPTVQGQESALGRYFATSAELESASVDAFRILAGELRAHGAPDGLIAAAEVAAWDEVRHAEMTRRLARRYGPVAPRTRASARPVRALAEIAEENEAEGCVKETYAALLAHHQALAARDGEVRETMTRIAVDETRHAALAWKVAAWTDARLDVTAKARVRRTRTVAVRELRAEVARSVPAPLTDVAGLPAPDGATRMLAVLEEALWLG